MPPPTTAVLDERVKNLYTILKASITAAVAWMAFLTFRLITLSTAVAHMEGKIGDPLATTVRQLDTSQPSDVLAASLAVLASTARLDRVSGRKTSPANVGALSAKVRQVAQASPEIPEAWRAAGEMVSLRSVGFATAKQQLPACFGSRLFGSMLDIKVGDRMLQDQIVYHDCSVDLDDVAGWLSTLNDIYPKADYRKIVLRFNNVVVHYRGGSIVPAQALVFVNCRFDLNLPMQPLTPQGQSFALNMLTIPLGSLSLSPKGEVDVFRASSGQPG